jgi:hypothetical protein
MTSAVTHPMLIPYIGEPNLSDYQIVELKIKRRGVMAKVDKINWIAYPYRPLVLLTLGYSDNYLWLLYEVENDFFRARARVDQEAVWEDSCVEFFVSTGKVVENEYYSAEDIVYRNFEFNALGTCLSAFGNTAQRESLKPEEMKQILRFPGINKEKLPKEGDEFNWKLAVAIPLVLLNLQPGSSFRANFYKCGDLTLKPHFLSLYGIESDSPDFHLPQFFGRMELAK